jgi:hypothetical protein
MIAHVVRITAVAGIAAALVVARQIAWEKRMIRETGRGGEFRG